MRLVLVLGSYDEQTLPILWKLKDFIAKTFVGEKEEVYSLLLENSEVYHGDGLFFLAESWSERKTTLMVFERDRIIEMFDIEVSQGRDEDIFKELKRKFKIESIQKFTVLEKYRMLALASSLILVIKHLELSRGGEFVELTMAAPEHGRKIWLLKKEGVPLSIMVKEVLDTFLVQMRTYDEENELLEEAERIIRSQLGPSVSAR